ncbi:MAG: c-type cytochrome [Magnetococcales bacterium]|nr:c-type cytochrome [Magnetococcales bacterium]
MKKIGLSLFAALFSLSFAASASHAGDVDAGASYVKKKCTMCHSFGDKFNKGGKVGPSLEGGIMDKKAGQIEGFKYSSGMSKAGEEGLVWDDATMEKYLTKPKDVVPKTKMAFPGIKSAEDLANVIAFLKTL